MADRTKSTLASTSPQAMDSRFGTGLMEGGLKGLRLVEGDIVLSDFFGGRELKVFVDQGNINAMSLGALNGGHVPGGFAKILEHR
jgi:hypothetical protein